MYSFYQALGNALQVSNRRHANQQLVVDVFVDLELSMRLQPFMNGCFGVVANVPGAIGEGAGGEVFNGSVKHDAVAADGHQIGVRIQFGEHVLMRVVGVQGHQHPIGAIGIAENLLSASKFRQKA